jgi:acetoin utilization deacetylase AcuC-like enzyme
MVEYLRQKYGLKKIAIIDTDVHHGDGTQEIFYNDPNVLFISFHQDGRTLYPGSGFMDELGGPLAYGSTINIPLAPRTTDTGINYAIDHLILPILDEFKPDIIVNSAGQDNHYSDPLANMSFSAQGYAILNSKLAPDIAVLEGGYSVETALPYINMGLIMAMAGIDYSNLREPDYSPSKLKESPSNLEKIKRMVEEQLNVFRNREETIAINRQKGQEFHMQYKNIFYDTDYIHEEQYLNLRLCPKCSGFRTIKSSARHQTGHNYRVLCITIPVDACETCQDQARTAYKDALRLHDNNYDIVYLQDRVNDQYKNTDILTGKEQVL